MKNVIVTGANRGLGLEIVKAIAGEDFHIILACRDVDKARNAISGLAGSFDCLELDLSSEQSIEDFVETVRRKYPVIDILVNNAGIYANSGELVSFMDQDLDRVWVTNTLGPFFLTERLAPLLNRSKHPACIFMCSVAGHGVNLELKTLYGYNFKNVYSQAKYGDLLISAYFRDKYPHWRVIATHPGYCNTEIFAGRKAGTLRDIIRFSTRFLAQDPAIGALGAIMAIKHPLPSGTYIVPDGIEELWGKPALRTLDDYYSKTDYEALMTFLKALFSAR